MNDLMKHRGEVLRALANKKFEVMDNGGLLLGAGINAIPMGVFEGEHRRLDPEKLARASALRRFAVESQLVRGIGRRRFVGGPARALRRWGKHGAGDLLGRVYGSNVIPTEGLNHILSAVVAGGSQVLTWYMALFEGNVTPGSTLTGATFTATTTECTNYDESTRVAFQEGAATGGVIDNASNRAVFTMNASKTIYGGALLQASAKSANTGVLLAAAKFASSRAVEDEDELSVKYTLTLTSA